MVKPGLLSLLGLPMGNSDATLSTRTPVRRCSGWGVCVCMTPAGSQAAQALCLLPAGLLPHSSRPASHPALSTRQEEQRRVSNREACRDGLLRLLKDASMQLQSLGRWSGAPSACLETASLSSDGAGETGGIGWESGMVGGGLLLGQQLISWCSGWRRAESNGAALACDTSH